MKWPNGLHGSLTVQASIKGVSGAWLEERDLLGLMSAVRGTVGLLLLSSGTVYLSHVHPRSPGRRGVDGRGVRVLDVALSHTTISFIRQ